MGSNGVIGRRTGQGATEKKNIVRQQESETYEQKRSECRGLRARGGREGQAALCEKQVPKEAERTPQRGARVESRRRDREPGRRPAGKKGRWRGPKKRAGGCGAEPGGPGTQKSETQPRGPCAHRRSDATFPPPQDRAATARPARHQARRGCALMTSAGAAARAAASDGSGAGRRQPPESSRGRPGFAPPRASFSITTADHIKRALKQEGRWRERVTSRPVKQRSTGQLNKGHEVM